MVSESSLSLKNQGIHRFSHGGSSFYVRFMTWIHLSAWEDEPPVSEPENHLLNSVRNSKKSTEKERRKFPPNLIMACFLTCQSFPPSYPVLSSCDSLRELAKCSPILLPFLPLNVWQLLHIDLLFLQEKQLPLFVPLVGQQGQLTQ